MRRRSFLLGTVALLAFAGTAEARMHAPYRGHRIVPASSAPLDGFASPSGAYSFRKLRTAYAGPAAKLWRNIDDVTADIGFTPAGDFDIAAATAFCGAGCSVHTMFDQSGNARDLINVTEAAQPVYVASCTNGKPCFEMTLVSQALVSTVSIVSTGVVSLSAVAARTAGLGVCTLVRENGTGTNNRMTTHSVANNWQLNSGTTINNANATEGSWHAAMAIVGVADRIVVDNIVQAGTVTGSTQTGVPGLSGANTTTCREAEIIIWSNYEFTAPEVTALQANQKSFWGTP